MAVKIDTEKCTGCGVCSDLCPTDAITINDLALVDQEKCVDCGTCVNKCPNEAISLDE